MKLFAFCFGVALAATVASVQGDPVAEKQILDYYKCQLEPWFLMGNTCLVKTWYERFYAKNKDMTDADWLDAVCIRTDGEFPRYETEGICCTADVPGKFELTAVERGICEAAKDANCIDNHDADCGQCVFELIFVPKAEIGGCCTNDCCNENKHEPLSYLEEVCNEGIPPKWTVLEVQNNKDVFIGPRVVLCSSEPYPLNYSNTKLGDAVLILDCYELCCPCCYNLDLTITDSAIPAKQNLEGALDTCQESSFMTQYAEGKKRTVYHGGVSICVNKNKDHLLISNNFGLISNDKDTYGNGYNYTAHVSCSKKLDGGNSGYPKNNTLY